MIDENNENEFHKYDRRTIKALIKSREIGMCESCKFYIVPSAEDCDPPLDDPDQFGLCKRHAPIKTMAEPTDYDPYPYALWPRVRFDESCGDFEKTDVTEFRLDEFIKDLKSSDYSAT